jgi:hypothetical protein
MPIVVLIVVQINSVLSQLHETLIALESTSSTLDDVLPAMDYMLEVFEAKKDEFKDDPVIGPCINSGWSKLDKYYSLTSDSPVSTAALVLNPAFKWEYIGKTWPRDWIPQAREAVPSLWKLNYRPPTSAQVPDTPTTATNNHFRQWKAGKRAAMYIPN